MIKTLNSGLKVDDGEYYRLLEWVDRHPMLFNQFCDNNLDEMHNRSINRFGSEEYELLVKLANIRQYA